MGIQRRDFVTGLSAVGLASACTRTWAAPRYPLLFDSHIHLISQNLTRYPRAADEVPPGGAPGGASPPGAFVQQGKPHPVPTHKEVLDWWRAVGVSGGAVVQKKGTYGYDNSYILDSADESPKEMAPVVVLDALDPATSGKVEMLARVHGLAGVRLTGPRDSYGWLSSPTALKTWAVADRLGLVIDVMYVMPGYFSQAIDEIVRVAALHPRTRVVLDHVGWPRVEDSIDYGINADFVRRVSGPNLRFKLTTINLDILDEAKIPNTKFVTQLVAALGAKRLMWGSDMGNSAGTYAEMVARILAATERLGASDRAALLHDSGARTFVRGGTIKL